MKAHRVITGALLILSLGAVPALAQNPLLHELEEAFISLGEEIRPAVVNIDARVRRQRGMRGLPGPPGQGMEDFFKFFGLPVPEDRPEPRPVPATGSGFIYDKDGHIITNNHVIENAESITVKLWDETEYPATVVGRDEDTDLAVIKIDADRDLPVAKLGDSDEVRIGQYAITAGSPQGLEGSFSFGHITALGRHTRALQMRGLRFQNLLQTDAAINFGNSGGPLCNIKGEVVGINVAIVFGAQSLGFAIPINRAKAVVPILIAEGRVTRGYLGIGIRDADELAEGLGLSDGRGAYVDNVEPDTPAAEAGIQVNDVLLKVNDVVMEDARDLVETISAHQPDETVTLEVWREGATMTVEVTLAEYPGNMQEARLGRRVLGMQVQPLVPQLRERLGIEADAAGVIVADVEPGSAADEAGIRPNDIILQVATQDVNSVSDFRRLVDEHAVPGRPLLIRTLTPGQRATTRILTVPEEVGDGE